MHGAGRGAVTCRLAARGTFLTHTGPQCRALITGQSQSQNYCVQTLPSVLTAASADSGATPSNMG